MEPLVRRGVKKVVERLHACPSIPNSEGQYAHYGRVGGCPCRRLIRCRPIGEPGHVPPRLGPAGLCAGEVIRGINSVPVDGRTLRQYLDAIEKRPYPPPDRLAIEVVSAGRGSA
ncbi:hypothetical protein [Kitasatospora sp. RG8]|uniref:hypothetical protein n=1 Tax=Kitasatospora sp. RG8 TaxID=2820815 RepID=UPI0035A92EB3